MSNAAEILQDLRTVGDEDYLLNVITSNGADQALAVVTVRETGEEFRVTVQRVP